MLVVGLTGGIASGKSLIAEHLEALGATVIDTDVLAREALAPGGKGLEAVRAAFGDSIMAPDGSLDRAALRRRIFADSGARSRLEAIVHPIVESMARARMAEAGGAYVVLVVPLLVEKGWQRLVDRILLVDVPEAVQLERLCRRDGLSAEEARLALAAQASAEERRAHADDVINNSGDPATTLRAVNRLHEHYLAAAGGHADPT